MKHAPGSARAGAVRTAADALDELSAAAQEEFDQLGRRARDDVARITHAITAAGPQPGSAGLTAALGDLAVEMDHILDSAADQVTAVLGAEADALAALLSPAASLLAAPPDEAVAAPATAGAVPAPPATEPRFLAPDISSAPSGKGHVTDPAGEPDDTLPAAAPHASLDADDEPPPLPDLSDIEAAKGTREWAEAVVERYPRLTVDEVLAIHEYTTVDGVRLINGHLRNPSNTSPAERERAEKLIADAASGLSKLPTYAGVTFRGTGYPDEVLDQWQLGKVVQEPAFLSSSTDFLVAESFRRGRNTFITVFGETGVDIQQLSYYGRGEAEILFKPGTRLHVLGRTWDDQGQCWRFEVAEVTQ